MRRWKLAIDYTGSVEGISAFIYCTKEREKMDKNAKFRPNLVVLGQKILIITGEIKSFGTHIRENPPRHPVHIGFWSGIGQKVQKLAIFGPK